MRPGSVQKVLSCNCCGALKLTESRVTCSVSIARVRCECSVVTCRNLPPGKLRPRMSLTCVVAMIMAAAEVKPTDTGPLMKSIRNPADTYNHHHHQLNADKHNRIMRYDIPLRRDGVAWGEVKVAARDHQSGKCN